MFATSQAAALVGWSVLSAVVGALAYLISDRFGRSRGVTPWRLPSMVWALIALVSVAVLPLVLLALPVACLTTPSSDKQRHGGQSSPAVSRTPAAFSEQASSGDRPATDPQVAGVAQVPLIPERRDLPLFGWSADPSGRHQHRYWDGRYWTEHVRDDGVRSIDPPV